MDVKYGGEMSNKKNFNLIINSWIPVVNLKSNFEKISLMQALCEGEKYSDLAVRPHERVALMRLLICIAHAALKGSEDYEIWKEIPEALPDAAKTYLEKWKDSFWLFHPEKPFLQIAALDYADYSPVTKLDFACATGNNTTLFDHLGNTTEIRSVSLDKIGLDLLTYQNFSPGGGLSITQWGNIKTKQVGNPDAPCVAASMLHTYLRGKNLLESVWLNTSKLDDIRLRWNPFQIGKPYWEAMPQSPDDQINISNATETYLGRLVPLSRWIKLISEHEMMCGNGFKYNGFSGGFKEEPSATIVVKKIKNKEDRFLLSYQSSRLIWRDLSAIAQKRKLSDQHYGPLCIENIYEQSCDLQVLAISRNQATILDSVDSVLHCPVQLLSEEGQRIYSEMVFLAEKRDIQLGTAVNIYRLNYDGGWEGRLKNAGPSKGEILFKLKYQASIHYWPLLENHKHLLTQAVEALDDPDRVDLIEKEWNSKVFQAALESYRLACEQESPRGMRAFALGWKVLTGKDKITTDKEDE